MWPTSCGTFLHDLTMNRLPLMSRESHLELESPATVEGIAPRTWSFLHFSVALLQGLHWWWSEYGTLRGRMADAMVPGRKGRSRSVTQQILTAVGVAGALGAAFSILYTVFYKETTPAEEPQGNNEGKPGSAKDGGVAQGEERAAPSQPPAPLIRRASEASKVAEKKKYAAFVSHYKLEAAMEARFVQMELEKKLDRLVFLDSDDLRSLTQLQVPHLATCSGRSLRTPIHLDGNRGCLRGRIM